MKIAMLVGSLRQDSLNMQLALTIQERYKDKLDIDILDLRSLPHFDQDLELDPPEVVKGF